MRTRLILAAAACVLLACTVPTPAPTPEPTATWTPEPTATPVVIVVTATPEPTPTVTPTPQFIAVPPVEMLTDELAGEIGLGFVYWEFHFVPADTEVWIIYGQPETQLVHRAIFRFAGGEWSLVGSELMETPTPTPAPAATPGAGREARVSGGGAPCAARRGRF